MLNNLNFNNLPTINGSEYLVLKPPVVLKPTYYTKATGILNSIVPSGKMVVYVFLNKKLKPVYIGRTVNLRKLIYESNNYRITKDTKGISKSKISASDFYKCEWYV